VQASAPLPQTPLVRLLADLAPAAVDGARQDFAQKVGQWLGAFDAVTLHSAHQSMKALVGDSPLGASPHSPAALKVHFQRVRATLVEAVGESVPGSGDARVDRNSGQSRSRPVPVGAADEAGLTDSDAASFAVHRQHCQALQRHMGLKIGTLRAQVRQVLAHGSAPLRQLAELDAVWEQMLSVREQKLMSAVPTLLEKRFVQLRDSGQLHRYAPVQRAVLLAELDVRLLPVAGLVEAFDQEANRHNSHE